MLLKINLIVFSNYFCLLLSVAIVEFFIIFLGAKINFRNNTKITLEQKNVQDLAEVLFRRPVLSSTGKSWKVSLNHSKTSLTPARVG